jgi:hypothetical protein
MQSQWRILMNKLRVYKFEAAHGGGHQSHTVEYKVYDWEDADYDWDAEERCMLEEWSQQFNNVRSTIELLDLVPVDVLAELIDRYYAAYVQRRVVLRKLLALPKADARMQYDAS